MVLEDRWCIRNPFVSVRLLPENDSSRCPVQVGNDRLSAFVAVWSRRSVRSVREAFYVHATFDSDHSYVACSLTSVSDLCPDPERISDSLCAGIVADTRPSYAQVGGGTRAMIVAGFWNLVSCFPLAHRNQFMTK